MISLQKNFLFIHVPKTGGNSIQNILREYSEDEIVCVASHQDGEERFEVRNDKYVIEKHSTLVDYKKELEPIVYESLFKFSTIRNPWDRMISFYFSPNRKVSEWNRDDFIKLVNRVKPVRDYISVNIHSEKRPLANDIDFILRFERLNEDFSKVSEVIGLPCIKLPHKNKSTRRHYSNYYDEALIELVKNKFWDEIEFGNYLFEKS